MRSRDVSIPATRGGSALVTLTRGEYSLSADVNGRSVLFKISGKPWQIGHTVDDLALVLDAARGVLELMEGSQ